MKEAGFIRELRNSIPKQFPGEYIFHWKNNNVTFPGIADIEIVRNYTYYIECKYVARPPKSQDAKILTHPFTAEQYKFAYLTTKAGGLCIGLIGFGNTAFIIPAKDLECRNFSYNELIRRKHIVVQKMPGNIWPINDILMQMHALSKREL